jgi:protein SCO1/2
MPSMLRTPVALVPYLVAAAMILGGILSSEGDRIARLGRTVETGAATIGGPFALIDQFGKPRTPGDFHGRFMLVYFGYSFCPDVCPTTLAEMGSAIDRLGPKKARVTPVFMSIDPERDTPGVLKEYLKSFGPNFVGLTGSMKSVQQAAQAYHVYIRKHPLPGGNYSMDHSGVIYLMAPDGRFVTYYEEELGPDKIAEDLRRRL